ncbi:MAG TPA: hypothetical protein VFJ29_06645, partial [Candidatus Kapabacteria bacterium]|nr:hypothetical protein [Candidatus Kapabacteria bacterium]
MTVRRRIVTVLLFVVGFSFVESSVVVYLQRAFFEGGTNSFPMKLIDLRYLKVELIREAATIIVHIAAAMMLERGRWRVFWMFSIMFAAWDILYYIWLNILTGSPSSLLDWDILFLIPTPWLAPVLAPVLVSILLIVAGVIMLKQPGNASLGLYEMLAGVS